MRLTKVLGQRQTDCDADVGLAHPAGSKDPEARASLGVLIEIPERQVGHLCRLRAPVPVKAPEVVPLVVLRIDAGRSQHPGHLSSGPALGAVGHAPVAILGNLNPSGAATG